MALILDVVAERFYLEGIGWLFFWGERGVVRVGG
jgi:hypothetical protein